MKQDKPNSKIIENKASPYILVFFVIFLISISAIISLYYLYRQAEYRTNTVTLNIASSMVGSIDGLIDTTDIALQSSADLIQKNNSTPNEITDYLKIQSSRIKNTIIRASDKDGNIIYNGEPNNVTHIKNRDYFNILKNNDSAGLIINKPVIGKITNTWLWIFARRINDQNGNFNGVVFSRIENTDIEKILDSSKLESKGSIALHHSDLTLIAAALDSGKPEKSKIGSSKVSNEFLQQLKNNKNEGHFYSISSAIDGLERHLSYKRSQKYDFYILVGIPTKVAFLEWYLQVIITSILCSVVFLILFIYSRKISTSIKEQELNLIALNEAQDIALIGSYELNLNNMDIELSESAKKILEFPNLPTKHVKEINKLIQKDYKKFVDDHLNKVIKEKSSYEIEYPIITKNNVTKWVHCLGKINFSTTGQPLKLIGTIQDITERKKTEEKIKELSSYDFLTGLHNRQFLLENIKQSLAISSRTENKGAILFIDLDNFKTLNDTRGHEAGDCLLKEVAKRLQENTRQSDTIARIGGDEFVVMFENIGTDMKTSAINAKIMADKILVAIREPYLLFDHQFQVTPSIGVTIFDGLTKTVEDLIKEADIAMYAAKTSGRNSIQFFDPKMQQSIIETNAIENDLKIAINSNQFELFYQPQVNNKNNTIGAEALIRWNHPTRGIVSPAEFIPVAESSLLIINIGQWVLQQACNQLSLWQENPLTSQLSIAVNVSAVQFKLDSFVQDVLSIIKSTNINPHLLKLELTEGTLLTNTNDIILKMTQLKELGISFSLDDFGTGYSSLSYLKKLPLDQLKIDQSFVRDVTIDSNDAVIAKTIIALGHTLGLSVLAEGVETIEQKQFLTDAGCLKFQGYLFSKPLPLLQFLDYLKK